MFKAVYSKPTANMKLNGEKLKTILLKSGKNKAVHPPPVSLQHISIAMRQHKEVKEEVKVLLFADDIILYSSDYKNSTKELLQLINTLSGVAGYKIDSKNK